MSFANPITTQITNIDSMHSDLLEQINQIVSSLDTKATKNSQTTSIKETLTHLINDIQTSVQNFNILKSNHAVSISPDDLIKTQLAMEKFTVTTTALSKLIGSVEKGVSTLMHGQ